MIETCTYSVYQCICDAIIVINKLGKGEASLFSQRVFQKRDTTRHVAQACVREMEKGGQEQSKKEK
jgi:hypothetical protein